MACNMEGQINLIDRLSSPSDRLIHCISHLSEEETLAKLNPHVSFASEYMALQFATLTSVKRAMVSRSLKHIYLEIKVGYKLAYLQQPA